jgi:hypothetical protein
LHKLTTMLLRFVLFFVCLIFVFELQAQVKTTLKINISKSKKEKESEQKVNETMDKWHHAAAVADEATFFGTMTQDAIYIGTDPKEKWYRDELKDWSKKYFDRDTAWAFKPLSRSVYFNDDHKMAWFEENLETRMKICHGSGVLIWTKNGWKIKHYVLSAAVPNDMMNDYLKLYEQK